MVYIQALIHLMHKKYKFIQNQHLIISSFFDNLEATLESVDDVNDMYELKLNYEFKNERVIPRTFDQASCGYPLHSLDGRR